jgi:hypothetical protein
MAKRCKGYTDTHVRCRNETTNPSGYCWQHIQQYESEAPSQGWFSWAVSGPPASEESEDEKYESDSGEWRDYNYHHDPSPDRIFRRSREYVDEIDTSSIDHKYGTGYKQYLDGFVITKLLGRGTSGIVYELQKPGKYPRAIKFSTERHMFEAESDIHGYLTDLNTRLTPGLLASHSYMFGDKFVGILIMDRISDTLTHFLSNHRIASNTYDYIDMIERSLKVFFNKMRKYGIVHTDLHWDNIAITYNSDGSMELQVIDWGLARQKDHVQREDACIDVAQMLSTFYGDVNDSIILHENIEPVQQMFERLWSYYDCEEYERYGIGYRDSNNYWETIYNRLYDN